ncbi:MFS transporter [Pseudonocardia spinosispora]|uniref:MFS transporter n=1 Tax=Pseudonocardia spinosispora TaxID=103441 RepID=UPI00048C6D46|nr:MFS transporter [Pseudonocardia spinosispora]
MAERRNLALTALCLAFFVVQLDATVVTVALQVVRSQLGGSLADQQWVVDSYTIALAASMLGAGSSGDRFGARKVCLTGLMVFGLASVLCALAPDITTLVAARVLQGVGAAALLPCSLALIVRQFPDASDRARALGVWGGIGSLGLTSGPILGGALVVTLGWQTIFLVNVPCCLLAIALIQRYALPAPRGPERLDIAGLCLGTMSLTLLVGAFIEFGQYLAGASLAVGLLVGAAVLGGGFVLSQSRAAHPMLPMDVFGSTRYSSAVSAGFLFNFCLYGALLCLSLYLQGPQRFSAWHAGLLIFPLTVAIGVGAVLSGWLTAALGPRVPMLLGFAAGGAGALIMVIGGAVESLLTIVAGATLLGCCSLAMPAMTSVAISTAEPARTGLLSGVFNTARQSGGALGVAMLGALLHAEGVALVLPMAVVVLAYLAAIGAAIGATRAERTVAAATPR